MMGVGGAPDATQAANRRDLVVASLTHALHDGYTDLLYVLLPVWQKEFGLTYAALAGLRALYYGTMAAAQVPGTRWFGKLGPPLLLVSGTSLAAVGFVIAGLTGGLLGLGVGLVVSGLGSSTQHPNGSALVSQAYGEAARGPLGVYNFAGDAGKAIFPAMTSLLLLGTSWRGAAFVLATIGIVAAVAIRIALPSWRGVIANAVEPEGGPSRGGFPLLFLLGLLDTACRMGFLLFLPFILQARGASDTTIGLALALVFIGGACGKAVCGWLGARTGLLGTVVLTEVLSALMILATLALPLVAILILLPILGVMLNGTSSVLYGTVPDFSGPGRAAHMFAIFYTGVIGAGALAPIAYGAFADVAGRTSGTVAAAATALATLPIAILLARALREPSSQMAFNRATGSPLGGG